MAVREVKSIVVTFAPFKNPMRAGKYVLRKRVDTLLQVLVSRGEVEG